MSDLKRYSEGFRPHQGEPPWLTAWRSDSLARFAELGLPTRRQESWRFTNLAPLEKTHFAPAAPAAGADASINYHAVEGSVRMVIANGRCGALSLGDPLAPKPRF